jgi:hypothetical protein
MAETLGSLCDKLTIVKLKEYHSDSPEKTVALGLQRYQLCDEIDAYILNATSGEIPKEKLVSPSLKIYKKEGNEIQKISGDIGFVFSELATINCKLWHDQEKVYEFEKVPPDEKDVIVKRLAILNLQRNQCIDMIDKQFHKSVVTCRKNTH